MANNKSSKKRIKVTERNRLQNRVYKSSIRTFIKIFLKNKERYEYEFKNLNNQDLNDQNFKKLLKSFNHILSLIDKAKKKNVFHKNYASRKKSNLSNYIKNILLFSFQPIFNNHKKS